MRIEIGIGLGITQQEARDSVAPAAGNLLLEDSNALLLEDGGTLLIED